MVQPRLRPLLLRPVLSHASSFFLPSILHSHNRSSTTSGVFHPFPGGFHIFRASLCSILTTFPPPCLLPPPLPSRLATSRLVPRERIPSGRRSRPTLDPPPPKSTVILRNHRVFRVYIIRNFEEGHASVVYTRLNAAAMGTVVEDCARKDPRRG